jgi:hypothetical protein
MASKESKRPCRVARAELRGGAAAGGGGRARPPRHAPAKGANWREEQGAGLGARLGARLEGPARDGAAGGGLRVLPEPGAGPRGRPPLPPPSFGSFAPSGALSPGRRRSPRRNEQGGSFRACSSSATGSRPLSGGALESAGLWLPTLASWKLGPLRAGAGGRWNGGSRPTGSCYTWNCLSEWVVEPLYV